MAQDPKIKRTGKVHPLSGRPIYRDSSGEFFTEKGVTIEMDGKFFNLPSIDPDTGMELEIGSALSLAKKRGELEGPFDTQSLAVSASIKRSKNLGNALDAMFAKGENKAGAGMTNINEIIGAIGAGVAAAGSPELGAEILRQQATRREKKTQEEREQDMVTARQIGLAGKDLPSNITSPAAQAAFNQAQLDRAEGLSKVSAAMRETTMLAKKAIREGVDGSDRTALAASNNAFVADMDSTVNNNIGIYGDEVTNLSFNHREDLIDDLDAGYQDIAYNDARTLLESGLPLSGEKWKEFDMLYSQMDGRNGLRSKLDATLSGRGEDANNTRTLVKGLNAEYLNPIDAEEVLALQNSEGVITDRAYQDKWLAVKERVPAWDRTAKEQEGVVAEQRSAEARLSTLFANVDNGPFKAALEGAKTNADIDNRLTLWANSPEGAQEIQGMGNLEMIRFASLLGSDQATTAVGRQYGMRKQSGSAEERRDLSASLVMATANRQPATLIDETINEARDKDAPVPWETLSGKFGGVVGVAKLSRKEAFDAEYESVNEQIAYARTLSMSLSLQGQPGAAQAALDSIDPLKQKLAALAVREASQSSIPHTSLVRSIYLAANDPDRASEIMAQAFGKPVGEAATFNLGVTTNLKELDYNNRVKEIYLQAKAFLDQAPGIGGGERASGIDPVDFEAFKTAFEASQKQIFEWKGRMPRNNAQLAASFDISGRSWRTALNRIDDSDKALFLSTMLWVDASSLNGVVDADSLTRGGAPEEMTPAEKAAAEAREPMSESKKKAVRDIRRRIEGSGRKPAF